jgi:hypothetical protein
LENLRQEVKNGARRSAAAQRPIIAKSPKITLNIKQLRERLKEPLARHYKRREDDAQPAEQVLDEVIEKVLEKSEFLKLSGGTGVLGSTSLREVLIEYLEVEDLGVLITELKNRSSTK